MGPDPDLENGKYKPRAKRSFAQLTALGLVFIGLVLVGFGGYKMWQKSKIIIPYAVKKQVSFVIYWPSKSAPVKNDKTTIKFDPTTKLLSYIAQTNDDIKLTISEQATPESFVDIPAAYDKFIENLLQYSAFESPDGKVFLTHPKELKGGQTAVMNTKGTLLFMKPEKDVSDDTWRKIFNNLDIIK
jgi:hypothetical protein